MEGGIIGYGISCMKTQQWICFSEREVNADGLNACFAKHLKTVSVDGVVINYILSSDHSNTRVFL